MKTVSEVVELIGKAMEQNHQKTKTWFIDFSGHVNTLSISYYKFGWYEGDNGKECCNVTLNENGIQEAYWFLKNRVMD